MLLLPALLNCHCPLLGCHSSHLLLAGAAQLHKLHLHFVTDFPKIGPQCPWAMTWPYSIKRPPGLMQMEYQQQFKEEWLTSFVFGFSMHVCAGNCFCVCMLGKEVVLYHRGETRSISLPKSRSPDPDGIGQLLDLQMEDKWGQWIGSVAQDFIMVSTLESQRKFFFSLLNSACERIHIGSMAGKSN